MSTTIINGVLILSGDLTCDEDIQVNGKIIPIPDEDYKKTFYSYQSNSYITANGKGNTIISTIGDIIVTGEIDGFGRGFESENGPGNNSLLEDSSGNTLTGYGSTHAGIGYIDNILAPSPRIPYGNHETPVSLGSGAGYYHDPVIFFGEETKGGGAIKLEAPSGTVRVNGTINMNGMDGTHVGGASGGSIWIDAWNIDGTGYMYSEGGSTLLASNAGGGGGGYISLWYEQNNTFTGILSVSGKSEGYDGKKYTKQIIPILEDRFTGAILNTKWWDASNSITLNNNLNLISINGDFNDPVVNSKFTISGKNITTNIDLIPKGLESTSYTAEFLLYSDTRNWVGVARKNSGIYGISSVDGFVSSTGIPFDYTNVTFRIIKEDSTFIYQYYDNTSTPQTLYTDIIPDLAYNTFKVKLRLNKPDPTPFISEYRRLSAYDISNQYIELDAPPSDTSAVALNLTYGTSQYLNTDFYISGRKLSWDSTGCSGILISLLEVGDTLRVMYPWDYTSYNGMEILFDNFKVTEGIIGNAETTEPIIYVDSDYGSDSSEGLQLSPLKNLFVATAWAKRGGTIILYDGTYNSTSIIGKDITIRGANGVKPLVTTDYVKDTTGSGWEETAISLYGCQGLIENIKINNSVYGIKVENGNFDLINNEIYDSIYGISFLNCDPLVARNKIYRCTERGLDFTSCIPPKIYSNVIHDSSVALYAGNTPDMTVSFNTFDNNQSHIVLDYSSATVISSNNLTYSVVGIQASPDSSFASYYNNFYAVDTSYSRTPDDSTSDFAANPLYYDRLGGDYHISVGSPCINAGITTYDDFLIDFDGADRTSRYVNTNISAVGSDFTANFVKIFPVSNSFAYSPIGIKFNNTSDGTASKYIWNVKSPTITTVLLNGTIGTVVPLGTRVKDTVTLELHKLQNSIILSRTRLWASFFTVRELQNNTTYSITLEDYDLGGPQTYTYTSDLDATIEEIVDGLMALISYPQIYPLKVGTDSVAFTSDIQFNITVDSKIDLYTYASTRSVNLGTINVNAGSLTSIYDTVTGFDKVKNVTAGSVGIDYSNTKYNKDQLIYTLTKPGIYTVLLSGYNSSDILLDSTTKNDCFTAYSTGT